MRKTTIYMKTASKKNHLLKMVSYKARKSRSIQNGYPLILLKAFSAASIVFWMSSSECAVDKNNPSN
jgi:hypothetical protein